MNKKGWYGLFTLGIYSLAKWYVNYGITQQQKYIDAFDFPITIKKNVVAKYPHLTESDLAEVIRGLRTYFHICLLARKRQVSMPSQVVDVAWHEFILFTKQYKQFCDSAFKRFLHHMPAEAMTTPTIAQNGIKRAWALSCAREKINRESPEKLPLLFAIDEKLKIPDGFFYAKNCKEATGQKYCASHIGCGGGCATGVTGCNSDSSNCGSGCGGGD
jgi:hypothetical protein